MYNLKSEVLPKSKATGSRRHLNIPTDSDRYYIVTN